jgi:FG-GAP-like repeat
MPRARRRAAIAFAGTLCATIFLAASGSVPAAHAGSMSALVTKDAVIPPDSAPAAIDDQVLMAGATGFLHQYDFSGKYLWTDYATGHTVTVPALAGVSLGEFTSAGGDSVAVINAQAINTAGEVSELDLADMTWQHWTVPAGHLVLGVFGNSVLVAAISAGKLTSWQVMTFAQGGTDTVTTVTGLPAGATLTSRQPGIGDASAAVVLYGVNGAFQYGLLDLATAVVVPIPNPGPNYRPIVLSSDRVGFYDPSTEAVRVYSRAGLLDGSDTAQTVTLPGASGTYQIALAGDHVIAVPGTSECVYCVYTVKPALDVPLSGAVPGQALAEAQTDAGAIAQAPGGAALVVGGTGPGDWSVRRLTVDGSDNLSDTEVLPLTGPVSNGGLSISQGLVRHIEVEPVPGGAPNYLLFNHMLVPDTTSYLFDPRLDGGILASALPCTPGGSCVRTVDGNWYGTSYLQAGTASSIVLREVIDGNTSSASMSLPSASGTIADAALNYVIVNGVRPARQYVADVGHAAILRTGPVTGAALWFDTLWHSDGAGRLQATDLDTGRVSAPIATGARCTVSEIQATERWIYWTCGLNGPAGVYDLRTRADIPVPAGPMLLGDGYLVQHNRSTGDLTMYDVHDDSVAAPVTLASVPAGPASDDRGITWAVDKYSGDVAYVASDDSVHVINTGVPATSPAITYPPGPWLPQGITFGATGGWYQGLALSRPVTSWTLTIRRAGTAVVVHTQSGGAARAGVFADWNGYLAGGAKAYSGPYTWSLSVTTAGSSARFTIPGSTLRVQCGQIPFRSYDCNGEPSLLADTGGYSGESDWYNGTDSGGLSDNGYTDSWPLCSSSWCVSAIVPFGDVNGDGFADVLVRYRSGVLRAYLGFGQTWFNTQGVKSINLGTGWNAYNALAYPGDLTRDGKPDLVARDGKGRLWLFASTGKGSFRRRVEISGGWGSYVRLIGAGDLTGDGIGDLLAIDKSGTMWLFKGNGHGGFAPRRYVSSGWSRYNAVIGIGDLSVDGCNDLVARDHQGTLWRFDGNCRGGFARPVKISQGWGKYQGLF